MRCAAGTANVSSGNERSRIGCVARNRSTGERNDGLLGCVTVSRFAAWIARDRRTRPGAARRRRPRDRAEPDAVPTSTAGAPRRRSVTDRVAALDRRRVDRREERRGTEVGDGDHRPRRSDDRHRVRAAQTGEQPRGTDDRRAEHRDREPPAREPIPPGARAPAVDDQDDDRDRQDRDVLPRMVPFARRNDVLRGGQADRENREQQRRNARAHRAASAGATAVRNCASVWAPSIPRTTCPSRPTITVVGKPIDT